MFLNEKIKKLVGIDQLSKEDQDEAKFIFNRAAVSKGEERTKNITRLFQIIGADRLEKDLQDNLRDKLTMILDKPDTDVPHKMQVSSFKWNSFAKEMKPVNEKIDKNVFKWTDASGLSREEGKDNQDFDLITKINLEPRTILIDPISSKVVQSTYKGVGVNQLLTPELITSLKRRGITIRYIEVNK